MVQFFTRAAAMRNGVAVDLFIDLMDAMLNAVLNNGIYQGCISALIPVGVILCAIYFSLELMDRATSLQFNIEAVLFLFMRFLVAYTLVNNIDTFIAGFATFVNTLNGEILAQLTATDALSEAVRNNNDLINIGNTYRTGIGASMVTFNVVTALMFNTALQFLILGIGVKRALTIGVKGVLAPIIVPDIFHNGLNSSGVKFLKGLLANYLQTTIVLFVVEMCCIVAFTTTIDNIVLTMTSQVLSGFVCLFVLIGSLKKTDEYAQALMAGFVK